MITQKCDCYADCPPKHQRDLLMLLAGQDQTLAAACLRDLLTEHGLARDNHARTFSKLRKRTESLHEYVLPLIESADEDIGHVVDLVNYAIGADHLEASALAPIAASIETNARNLLESARAAEASVRSRWRVDEDYFYLRQQLGAWIDLVGTVPDCDIEILDDASGLEDPLISLNVVAALLKRGSLPPAGPVERAAHSYETCADLYRVLAGRAGRLDLFPGERANFEHFAASEMVAWLLYPAELGYEPPEIELMATIDAQPGDESEGEFRRWCLWRFTDLEGTAYAGVSGPYEREALEKPDPATVRSHDVFSAFNEWDSKSPREHIDGMLENLVEWRIDFRSR